MVVAEVPDCMFELRRMQGGIGPSGSIRRVDGVMNMHWIKAGAFNAEQSSRRTEFQHGDVTHHAVPFRRELPASPTLSCPRGTNWRQTEQSATGAESQRLAGRPQFRMRR